MEVRLESMYRQISITQKFIPYNSFICHIRVRATKGIIIILAKTHREVPISVFWLESRMEKTQHEESSWLGGTMKECELTSSGVGSWLGWKGGRSAGLPQWRALSSSPDLS